VDDGEFLEATSVALFRVRGFVRRSNGFGNRFLFGYTFRQKPCPNGGPDLDWSAEIIRLHEVLTFRQGCPVRRIDSSGQKDVVTDVPRLAAPELVSHLCRKFLRDQND
jgi:hypothetical protein